MCNFYKLKGHSCFCVFVCFYGALILVQCISNVPIFTVHLFHLLWEFSNNSAHKFFLDKILVNFLLKLLGGVMTFRNNVYTGGQSVHLVHS